MWKYFLLLFLPVASLHATGDSLRYLGPRDTIFLTVSGNDKFFEHQIVPGQTVFSLARFYGVSMDVLRFYNPSLNFNAVAIGQKVKVPIPNRAIIRYKPAKFNPKLYAPVFYRIKPGDNLFRISRVYFKMPEDTIIARAKLGNSKLQPGRLLRIGWLKLGGIPAGEQVIVPVAPTLKKLVNLKKTFDDYKVKKKEVRHQGVAIWEKEAPGSRNYFALHESAPLRSIIELYNPVTKRTVYAEVLGRIPQNAYQNSNLAVMLSPQTAKMLGAKDPRFFIKVKYYK